MKLSGSIHLKADPSAGLLKRVRAVMAREGSVQARLDQFVELIVAALRINVASIYLRSGDTLELCATKGLKQAAVHQTKLRLGEGLVGRVARTAELLNLAEAPEHPDFVYRPETGEEKLHSFLAVPLLRGGRNLGVLVIQSKKTRAFTEAEVEGLLTVATILAEVAIEDERAGGKSARLERIRLTPTKPEVVAGQPFADGLAKGQAFLHFPPVLAGQMIAENIEFEETRIEEAIGEMRKSVDQMVAGETASLSRASREIFESYRMFAYDRQWVDRLREAVHSGLSAEAAVERVRNEHRARLMKARDPYLRARLHDLEDLANRMLRSLAGENLEPGKREIPGSAIVFARNLGPAEVLDYDRANLKGIVLEEGTPTSHATIICRTLGIPLVGLAREVLDCVEGGDPVLVDGETGDVFIRPLPSIVDEFTRRIRVRSDLSEAYARQRDLACATKDGRKISLLVNAALLADLPKLNEVGADGIGLFRTEFQFMIAERMPSLSQQIDLYAKVLDACGERPTTFRTLDLGGDKILPYVDPLPEENPAIGWRAIRIGLDRPALLRYQLRALLAAGKDRHLRLMFPMVSTVEEFKNAKTHLDLELDRAETLKTGRPGKIDVGVMLETPSLAWQVDAICKHADFISVGANDLMQFFFAADRCNPRVANRYDHLHPAGLSMFRYIADRCKTKKVDVSICGEITGKPLEALCLIALGYTTLSMPMSGVGPVKSALLATDSVKLHKFISPMLKSESDAPSIRNQLEKFCTQERIPI